MLQRESDYFKTAPITHRTLCKHTLQEIGTPQVLQAPGRKVGTHQQSRGHTAFIDRHWIFFSPLSGEKRVSLLPGMSGDWSSSAGTISVLHSCGETASKSLFQQPGSTYSFITKSSMLEAREQISLGGSLKLFIVFLLTVSAELLTLNSLQTEINSTSARTDCKPAAGFKRYAVGISAAQSVLKKDCRKLENADISSIIHDLTVGYDNFVVQCTLCNSWRE